MTIGRRQFDTEIAAGIAGEHAVGVAIVTGGAGGIDAATCRQLADNGVAVVIVYRASHAQAQQLERDIADLIAFVPDNNKSIREDGWNTHHHNQA